MVATASESEKLVGELGRIVLGKITSGRLVLPVMPEIAQRCLATIRDPKFIQSKLTADLEREPLLAASVMKTALSAANAGTNVKTLDQAVSAIGQVKLKSLVVEFMTRVPEDASLSNASREAATYSAALRSPGPESSP